MIFNYAMTLAVLITHVQTTLGAGPYCDGRDPYGMGGKACCNGNCCDNYGQWLHGPTSRQIHGGEALSGATCGDDRSELTKWEDRETALPTPVFNFDTTFRETDPTGDGDWIVDVTTEAPKTAQMGIDIATVAFALGTAVLGPQVQMVVGTALAIAPLIDSINQPEPKMSVDLSNTITKLKTIIEDEADYNQLRINLESIQTLLDNIRSQKADWENDNMQTIQKKSQEFVDDMDRDYRNTFKESYITEPAGAPEAAYYMFENMMGMFVARYQMEQVAFVSKLAMIPGAPVTEINNIVSKKGWRDQACGDLKDYLRGAGSLGDTDASSFPYQWKMFEGYFETAFRARLAALGTFGLDEDLNLADVSCYHSWAQSGDVQTFTGGYKFVDNWTWGDVLEHKWGWEAKDSYSYNMWSGKATCSIKYTGNEIKDPAAARSFIEARHTDYAWQIRKKFKQLELRYNAMKREMEEAMEKQLLVCEMAMSNDPARYFVDNTDQRDRWCMKVEKDASSGKGLVNPFELEKVTMSPLGNDCRLLHNTRFQSDPDHSSKDKRFHTVASPWECKTRCHLDENCNVWSYKKSSKECFLRVQSEATNSFEWVVNTGVEDTDWVSGYGLQDKCTALGGVNYKPDSEFTQLPEAHACMVSWTDMPFMWLSGWGGVIYNNDGFTTEVTRLEQQCASNDRDGVRRTCEAMCEGNDECTGYTVISDIGMEEQAGGPTPDSCICYNHGKTTTTGNYECVVGQGESGKAYGMTNTPNAKECGWKCNNDPDCVGYDFTEISRGDSCRLFKDASKPRIGQPGDHDRVWCASKGPKKTCGSSWGFDVSNTSNYYQSYIKGNLGKNPFGESGQKYNPMPNGLVCPDRMEQTYWDERNLFSDFNSQDKTWMDKWDQDREDLDFQCKLHTRDARQKINDICQMKCSTARDMLSGDCVGYSVSSDEHWKSGGCLCVLYRANSYDGSAKSGVDYCPAYNKPLNPTPSNWNANYLTFKSNRNSVWGTMTNLDVQVLGGSSLTTRYQGGMDFRSEFLTIGMKRNAPEWPPAPRDDLVQNGDAIASFYQYDFKSDDHFICPNSIEVHEDISGVRRRASPSVIRRLTPTSPSNEVQEDVEATGGPSAAPATAEPSNESAMAPAPASTETDDLCKATSEADCTFPCAYNNGSCRYFVLSGPCQDLSTSECESTSGCAMKAVDHTGLAMLAAHDSNGEISFEPLVGTFCVQTTA